MHNKLFSYRAKDVNKEQILGRILRRKDSLGAVRWQVKDASEIKIPRSEIQRRRQTTSHKIRQKNTLPLLSLPITPRPPPPSGYKEAHHPSFRRGSRRVCRRVNKRERLFDKQKSKWETQLTSDWQPRLPSGRQTDRQTPQPSLPFFWAGSNW